MIDPSTLLAFALASAALTVFPGPAVLYIMTRSVGGGRIAGLVSAIGISAGGFVHVVFATVGLSAIIASSAAAFSVVKWVGVGYLVYLGLSRIFGKDEEMKETVESVESRRKLSGIFFQGALINVLNPKVALFFLAFLPQFIRPEQEAAWMQTILLGMVFTVVALTTDSVYALLGGLAGEWVRRRNRSRTFRRGQRYITGGVYLALGAVAAATGRGRN